MQNTYHIIISGNEILSGKRQDRHLHFLSRILLPLGLTCTKCFVVGDNDKDLVSVICHSLQEVSLVIVTGGLGPTVDDITREAISQATDIPLKEDPQALDELRQRFRSLGRPMSENNRRQALVPTSGCYLSNPNGTAPGLIYEKGDQIVAALPGPPRELEPLVENQLIPFLRNRFKLEKVMETRLLRFCCLGESSIDTVVREIMQDIPDLQVSSLSQVGTVDLTLSLPQNTHASNETLSKCVLQIKAALGDYIYSEKYQTLAEVTGSLLTARKESMAVAESCTGGMLGSQITSVPGSSSYFKGGIMAYCNDVKIKTLGVKEKTLQEHGAVSLETATLMAEGVRTLLNSTWGIGITGIAGPEGGTPEKPVGTVCIAVSKNHQKTTAFQVKLFGNREAVRQRSCIYALDQLRRSILGLKKHS